MSSDAPEFVQYAVSLLLYRAILSVCEQFIAWNTEWKAVDRNLAEAVVSNFTCFIVASFFLPLILRCFLRTLVGMLDSVKRCRKKLATIKQVKSDTTASARFLSTALHSVSQAINRSRTDKIAL